MVKCLQCNGDGFCVEIHLGERFITKCSACDGTGKTKPDVPDFNYDSGKD